MSKARAGEFLSKDKRKLPIFIQSELDDYGLSPIEFRTYARIARRAGGDSKLTESVPNMAEVFGVADVTVRRALQVLCLCGLISKKERPGWTPEYALNEQDKWRDKAELKAVRDAVLHPKKVGETLITTDRGIPDHQKREGVITTDTGPSSLETDEGTPVKVLPEGTPNGSPKSPKQSYRDPFVVPPDPDVPPYFGPAFVRALENFEAAQKELKKPIGPVRRAALYEKLAVWSEGQATQALIEATTNGWNGVFEPKEQNGNGSNSNGHKKNSDDRPIWMASKK